MSTKLTQVNTNDLALHLLLAAFRRVPSPEGCGRDSEGRGTSERRSAGELESEMLVSRAEGEARVDRHSPEVKKLTAREMREDNMAGEIK